MDATGTGHGPQQPDIRQRVGAALFRAIGPLMRLMLRRGLPTGPNVLLFVRGRVSGRAAPTSSSWRSTNTRIAAGRGDGAPGRRPAPDLVLTTLSPKTTDLTPMVTSFLAANG